MPRIEHSNCPMYFRNLKDSYGTPISFVVNESHGVLRYAVNNDHILNPVAVIADGKLALMQRGSVCRTAGPLHIYHAVLQCQTKELVPEEYGNVVDTRHETSLVPQTIAEAKACLDEVLAEVVTELDFINLTDGFEATNPRVTVLSVLQQTLRGKCSPFIRRPMDHEPRAGEITELEQLIIEHVVHGHYISKEYQWDGPEYAELRDYVDQKVEVIITEMNGALG